MKRSLLITQSPIDVAALLAQRQLSNAMGAAIYFAEVVRDTEGQSGPAPASRTHEGGARHAVRDLP